MMAGPSETPSLGKPGRFTTAMKFRSEVYWTFKQLMANKPDEMSKSDVVMMMYLGLMDFTLESDL